MATAPPGRALLRGLGSNLGLKLLALGLSVVLFAVVHSDVDAQRSIYVDVVALLPPPETGRMLVSEIPAQVRVTVRGSRSKLSELSRDTLGPIQIDLRDGSSGHRYIEASHVSAGSGVRVTEISPNMLPLRWAKTAQKRVPVQPELQGTLDKGLTLSAVEVTPASLTLRGSEPVLAQLSTVSTEGISVLGLGPGKHTRRMEVAALPAFVSSVEGGAVEVTLTVSTMIAERTLRRLDVAVVGEGRVAMRPDQVTLRLRGPEDALEEIDPRGLVPFVELTPAAGAGTRPLPVQVRGLPMHVEVAEVIPESVLVTEKPKP